MLTRSTLLLVACIASAAWAFFDIPRAMRRNARKQLRSAFQETFADGADTTHVLEVQSDGLHSRSIRGTSTFAWSAITLIDESDAHLYVGLSGASGFVVPKARTLEGDVGAFAAQLRQLARTR
jgi:hypothetical protein